MGPRCSCDAVAAGGAAGRRSGAAPSFARSFDLAPSGRSALRGVRGRRYVAATRLDGAHLAKLVRSLDADPTLRAVLLELAAARVDRRFEVRAGRLVVVFLAHLPCSLEADVDQRISVSVPDGGATLSGDVRAHGLALAPGGRSAAAEHVRQRVLKLVYVDKFEPADHLGRQFGDGAAVAPRQ